MNLAQISELKAQALKEYVNSIYMPNLWRKKMIASLSKPDQKHVYLGYPELFCNAFSNSKENKEEIDRLCIAGYFYYLSLIFQDKLIDNQDSEKVVDIPFISFSQEEAIKIIIEIFPRNHEIWRKWNEYRERYLKSITIDKTPKRQLTFEEFCELAVNKAVYAQFAIDCCYYLSNKTDADYRLYQLIVKSHELFSKGAQILDDFDDIEEDFRNNQKNIILQKCLKIAVDTNKPINTVNDLKKVFFISGYAKELLSTCRKTLSESYELVEHIDGVEIWKTLIKDLNKRTYFLLAQITLYLKETYARTFFSNSKELISASLEERIEKGKQFIFRQQEKDGSWSDIVTKQGISSVWATGFVVWNLSLAGFGNDDHLKRAIDYLLSNKSDGLWGYNSSWLKDVDSTSNVILSLFLNKFLDEKYVLEWLGQQNIDGSFGTYNSIADLTEHLGSEFDDYSGWVTGHMCVSALSFYVLSFADGYKTNRNKLLKYILNNQSEDGLWHSYWWTSPIYSTSLIAKSLIIRDSSLYRNQINKSINAMLKLQKDNNECSESPFYSFLLLNTLCTTKQIFEEYFEHAERILNGLFSFQNDDGSFPSSYILRIPAPHVMDPEVVEKWNRGVGTGVNCIANDFMRLFSTSLAVNTFQQYRRVTNSIEDDIFKTQVYINE